MAAIIVCVINSNVQQQKMLSEMDKHDALQSQRISQLERKMDQHNQLIERTYELEKRAAVQEKELKALSRRITECGGGLA